jgi:hypothetical protein
VEFGASIFFTDYSITPAELAADEGVANGASERGEMLACRPCGADRRRGGVKA